MPAFLKTKYDFLPQIQHRGICHWHSFTPSPSDAWLTSGISLKDSAKATSNPFGRGGAECSISPAGSFEAHELEKDVNSSGLGILIINWQKGRSATRTTLQLSEGVAVLMMTGMVESHCKRRLLACMFKGCQECMMKDGTAGKNVMERMPALLFQSILSNAEVATALQRVSRLLGPSKKVVATANSRV
jgi:hypothetical protein